LKVDEFGMKMWIRYDSCVTASSCNVQHKHKIKTEMHQCKYHFSKIEWDRPSIFNRNQGCRDRNVVGFTTTCAIKLSPLTSHMDKKNYYGVYISQLIRYARVSSNYSDFLKRHLHLRNRLLDQGYKKIRLIRSLKSL
jgi:hypothetical protein